MSWWDLFKQSIVHSRRRGQFAVDIESEMEVAPDEYGGHSNQAFITDENESEVQFSQEFFITPSFIATFGIWK